jgi:hypothetical protein
MIVAKAGLGVDLDAVAAQALKESENAPQATVAAGQPSYASPSVGGGGGTDWGGMLAKYGPDAAKAVSGLIKGGTGTAAGPTAATAGKTGIHNVCTDYLNKCKSFIASTANQTRYKTLMAKRNTAAAHTTKLAEEKACGVKFTSGGFGTYKVGDAKANIASGAYAKYQACTQEAVKKYRAATVLTKEEALFTAVFFDANDYVKGYDMAVKAGMSIVNTPVICASTHIKAALANMAKVSGLSTSSSLLLGIVVVGALGYAAWKLI